MTMQSQAQGCQLFEGMNAEQARATARALDARVVTVRRGDRMAAPREPMVVFLLEGRIHATRMSDGGQRDILMILTPGRMVGELPLPMPGGKPELIAGADSRLLVFQRARLMDERLPGRARLMQNLLSVHVQTQRALADKLQLLSVRRTRDRLMAFFIREAQARQSRRFEVPLSRQELADYLSVDRSALCSELTRLRRAGILSWQRQEFQLLCAVDGLAPTAAPTLAE